MKFFIISLLLLCKASYSQITDPTILQENENGEDKVKKFIFCKVILSKKRAYVNEPIVLTYKLYSALECNSFPLNEPSINNCSAYALPAKQDAVTEIIDNITFNTYELKKLQLYCNTPGIIRIDQIRIRNEAVLKKRIAAKPIIDRVDMLQNPEDYVDSYTAVPINFTIATQPEQIEILPLPVNSPDGFNGAVGNFSMESFAEKKIVALNEPVVLHYKISGKGNFPFLNSLEINFPETAEMLETAIVNATDSKLVPVSGFKIFTYKLLPADTGFYTIPAFDFVFFNPESQSYKKISADSMVLEISGRVQKNEPVYNTTSTAGNSRNIVTLTNGIIAAIVLTVAGFLFYYVRGRKKQKRITGPNLPQLEEMQDISCFEKTEKELLRENYATALVYLREELLKTVAIKNEFPAHLTGNQMLENLSGNNTVKQHLQEIISAIDREAYAGGNAVETTRELLEKSKLLVAKIS